MKAKKLFFGLFCLGALVLGACSGNKSSSSAPASSSSGSQPAPSSSEPAHVHQWDEHGVCSCGEYRGDTKAASSSDPYTKSLVAGEENYFRLQVEKDQYHAFFSSLEEEQIDLTKTKLWRKTNVWEELDIAYGIWYFGNNSDGYIYVKIVTLVNVASATAYTDVHHHYNWTDFGVCPYCGAYGGHEDWELNQGQFVHVNSGEKIWQRLPVQNNTDYGFFFDNTWPYAGVTEATIEIWYITSDHYEQAAEFYAEFAGDQLIHVGETVDNYLYFAVYFEGTAEDYEYDTIGLFELGEHAFDENNIFYGITMPATQFKSTDSFNLSDPQFKINGKYYVGVSSVLGDSYELEVDGLGEGDTLKAFEEVGNHIEELIPINIDSSNPFALAFEAKTNNGMVFEITSNKTPEQLGSCDLERFEAASVDTDVTVGALTTAEERSFIFKLETGHTYRYSGSNIMIADMYIVLVNGGTVTVITSSGLLESQVIQEGARLYFGIYPVMELGSVNSIRVSIAS